MARKKEETPITGVGKYSKNNTVQKSLPPMSLWQSDLTLSEFKILDTYLSRINSHNPEKRTVIFEKGELETLLGVKKINKQDLELRLRHLMGNVVEITDNDEENGFRLVTLFEEAVAEQGDSDTCRITLECTEKAMKYFFNIENLGYLKYKLRCITSITSRYSYIMFIYIEANRYRVSWDVSLDELKRILSCDKDEAYKTFKRFNDLILKRCKKELDEKTDCHFSYEPIKNGRTVVAIRFTLEKLSEEPVAFVEPREESLFDSLPEDDPWAVVRTSIEEFSGEEQDLIIQSVANIPLDKLPEDAVTGANAKDFRMAAYLDIAMAKLRLAESKAQKNGKPIKNRFNYLMKIIENDVASD